MGMIGRGFKRFKRSLLKSLACGSRILPTEGRLHHHHDLDLDNAPPSTTDALVISDFGLSESSRISTTTTSSTTAPPPPPQDPCLSGVIDNTPCDTVPPVADGLTSEADSPTSPTPPPDGERSSASVLIIDLVSIHSSILSSSIADLRSSEARRNPRSLFWDTFYRSSFRQNSDSPSVLLATSHHPDDLGTHDRWLLDFSGDLRFDRATRESRYSTSRGRQRSGQRWPSRYEMFHDVHDEHDWRASSLCDSGIHPRGSCLCDSSSTAEEPSSRGRVSQIFMLADALFEVLAEIHRQRLSLSLSMVSIPAPEAIVDSLPLKSYKKSSGAETGIADILQCHICLADYEEDDQIRVLPCSHEYHMSCVDKWLKEVQGVCPLCRGDVCKDMEGSTTNPQVSSA